MRGRVMSVYNVAFRGGMPFGSLLTGWLVPVFSAPSVLAVNGLLADTEPGGDLLPGPAERAGVVDLQGLQAFGQGAQGGHGA